MGKKCSIKGCDGNYENTKTIKRTHRSIYGFPPNKDELKNWISSIPKSSEITLETVTKHMGICALHWPKDAPFSMKAGRYPTPDVPPSIFPTVEQAPPNVDYPSSNVDHPSNVDRPIKGYDAKYGNTKTIKRTYRSRSINLPAHTSNVDRPPSNVDRPPSNVDNPSSNVDKENIPNTMGVCTVYPKDAPFSIKLRICPTADDRLSIFPNDIEQSCSPQPQGNRTTLQIH